MLTQKLRVLYGLCCVSIELPQGIAHRRPADTLPGIPPRSELQQPKAGCSLTVLRQLPDGSTDAKWHAVQEAIAQGREAGESLWGLRVWRALDGWGEAVDPDYLLFQGRTEDTQKFLCLMPDDDHPRGVDAKLLIAHVVESVALRWYTAYAGGPLHAAATARADQGCLFLGESGAGKSTVASLSQELGAKVVGEDRVMLSQDGTSYRLSHVDSAVAPVLRAVFVLKKGDANGLTPLRPRETCRHLSKSVLEYAVGQQHFGPWVRQAFHNMAEVARHVPGYVLEFRKSSDFWDVIDAELGK